MGAERSDPKVTPGTLRLTRASESLGGSARAVLPNAKESLWFVGNTRTPLPDAGREGSTEGSTRADAACIIHWDLRAS